MAPATIAVPVDWYNLLLRRASECADELAAIYDEQFPSRAEQPVQQRRYNRNMELVNDVRDLVARVREFEKSNSA